MAEWIVEIRTKNPVVQIPSLNSRIISHIIINWEILYLQIVVGVFVYKKDIYLTLTYQGMLVYFWKEKTNSRNRSGPLAVMNRKLSGSPGRVAA